MIYFANTRNYAQCTICRTEGEREMTLPFFVAALCSNVMMISMNFVHAACSGEQCTRVKSYLGRKTCMTFAAQRNVWELLDYYFH